MLTFGVLRAVYRLGIVQNVPLEGSISYLELSKRVNADIDRLRRVVQYAMTMRLFQELTPGHVSHSAITYMVAKEPVAHSWIGNNMEVIFPSSPFLADTLVDSADESGSPRTGPQLAFGFDGPFFGYLREKPGATKLFAEAMEFVSQPGGIGNAEFLVNAPVWRTLHDKAKIVDVGGGKGFVSVDILRRYATFTGVVQDLEEVVSQCTAPTDLIEKLSFQTANFLDPQPIQDADAYLLRRVLHDWSDQDCKRILQNIIPSMKTGSRLILSEFVVPEPGMMTSYEEKMMRTADMQMMLLLGGKERGFGEWKRIFEDVAEDKLNLEMVDSRIMVWQKV
ncbi:putative cercosporin toxin biosynthesis protein [Phaeomoniella chlamydospora]|uniref:Putative cercosporin toxin biosynthesis protein n=1 Tax=Phaeomoniella chlamydospora TaxID=158046 RepID=A0A0G2G3R1_PHACM|nr:putative cercosporin toxin biosynthesis protein [Phaeomoniella chlamydospora]